MWVQLEWTFTATGDEKFILLWVNNGGNGNVIFDEAFLVSKVDFLSCRTSLTFAPGKILKFVLYFFIFHIIIKKGTIPNHGKYHHYITHI